MSKAHDQLTELVSMVSRLAGYLRKSSTHRQIRGTDEKENIKAVSLTWFKKIRAELQASITKESLGELDEAFNSLLVSADKNPSRPRMLANLKILRTTLASLHLTTLVVGGAADTRKMAPPNFSPLIADKAMQEILLKRWQETEKCLACGASLAATVMMGGLLEGLLLARVNSEIDRDAIFKNAVAPKDRRTGKTLQLKEWTLQDYISVAHALNWIGKAAKDVGEVLRDYRNYVHPQKEFSHGVSVTVRDAHFFWQVVGALAKEIIGSI